MIDQKHIVRYNSFENRIRFPNTISSSMIPSFAGAIREWLKKRPWHVVTLDFVAVQHPYPNGMIPIISTITDLRLKGHQFKIILPNDANVGKLFKQTDWVHFLDPITYKSNLSRDRHLVTKSFSEFRDVGFITNDFMEVIIGSMIIPKDVVSALEWSIYEICDNVINHSDSKSGGYAQIVTYPKQGLISFTVADSGRGILNSLKEGIPNLKTDSQAIGEAIKSGVTRNKNFGQGNGLAGTLRITTMTGGQIDILSGAARFYVTSAKDNKKIEFDNQQYYRGTCISGQIRMNKKFSISQALDFGSGVAYTPFNIIDSKYEIKDEDCLLLELKEETSGFGTRYAGKQLRIKIINFISSKPNYPIYVDWEGVPVISSSFADEFMGKLFVELGALTFSATIRNKNMEILISQLLDKAISQRVKQEQQ